MRAAVLAALGGVDHIVPFEGLTALELVHAVRPDVYVKGGDHDAEALVEAPAVLGYGGRVHLTEALPDHSTTQVIVACSVAAREAVTARDGRDGGLEHVAGPAQAYEVLDLGSPAGD